MAPAAKLIGLVLGSFIECSALHASALWLSVTECFQCLCYTIHQPMLAACGPSLSLSWRTSCMASIHVQPSFQSYAKAYITSLSWSSLQYICLQFCFDNAHRCCRLLSTTKQMCQSVGITLQSYILQSEANNQH